MSSEMDDVRNLYAEVISESFKELGDWANNRGERNSTTAWKVKMKTLKLNWEDCDLASLFFLFEGGGLETICTTLELKVPVERIKGAAHPLLYQALGFYNEGRVRLKLSPVTQIELQHYYEHASK